MQTNAPKIITPEYLSIHFGIDLEKARRLHGRMNRIVYNNSENIVTLGEAADGLYFIEDGRATVLNADTEAVNEMEAGQCFGEYAILADEPRMTTVRAHGIVVAYRMSNEDFLEMVSSQPKLIAPFIKQIYGQVTQKHTKLISLSRKYRGILWSPERKKDTSAVNIIATYGITVLLFAAVFLLAGRLETYPVWWQILPVVFLMSFALWTKRVVEAMLLTVLLLSGMLNEGHFIRGFGSMLIEGIGNTDTAETLVIMAMVECFAALLAGVGVVSAFKKLASRYSKKPSSSMFGMLGIMLLLCIDESLNIQTAGYCTNEELDRLKVPRETRALLGSCSMALCSLIPFSLWSAYIIGWFSSYFRDDGTLFLKTIPFNLTGICSLIFALFLCSGRFPKTKQLKRAYTRVHNGGKLWSEGSEAYFETAAEDGIIGKPKNLILPMAVWICSSVIFGSIEAGSFSMDPVSGLIITLLFMFAFFIAQKILTPKGYFEIFADGIGNSLMLVLLFVLSERISICLEALGFDAFLEGAMISLVGSNLFLIPALLFVICSLVCIGMGSCWGMFGLGIPIAMYLSTRLGINIPLCLGSVLAAGTIGENLCPFLNESSVVVTSIGCHPVHYRRLCIQYWLPAALICTAGYIILGLLII